MIKSLHSSRFWLITTLIFFAAIFRVLLTSMAIAAPIVAIAIFGSVYLTNKRLAFIVPICAMLLSDIILQITYSLGIQDFKGFYPLMLVIYGCFAVIVFLGFLIRNRVKLFPIIGITLVSALFFYIITNLAVWMNGGYGYPLSFESLILCYEMAIPFFRTSIISNLVFVGVLFGSFELLKAKYPGLAKVDA